MTRELLLLRHGKSDWDAGTDDFHRPLKTRGVRGAQRIGTWLQQQGLIPDLILSSTATRALLTAELAANCMGLGRQQIQREKTLYLADLKQLLKVLNQCPESAQRVMLIGHNPGLEDLLLHLAANFEIPADGKVLPTATLARLAMPDHWQQLDKNGGQLIDLIRPNTLPEKFPYPDSNGSEWRDRPAYYYRQVATLPYRLKAEGEIEFLLIRSNKNRHWIIPKGIHAPGMTAIEAVAAEALEEAGVEGKISDRIVGHYEYEKWGGTCHVDIYSMEVTQVLPESQWPESHRGREWVSPKGAAKRIKEEALNPVFASLAEELAEAKSSS